MTPLKNACFPLILVGTATVCSRAVFASIKDPEGPNFVVVIILAALIWLLSLMFYLSDVFSTLSKPKRLLLMLAFQVILAGGLSFALR